jgi:hypothetical protein
MAINSLTNKETKKTCTSIERFVHELLHQLEVKDRALENSIKFYTAEAVKIAPWAVNYEEIISHFITEAEKEIDDEK